MTCRPPIDQRNSAPAARKPVASICAVPIKTNALPRCWVSAAWRRTSTTRRACAGSLSGRAGSRSAEGVEGGVVGVGKGVEIFLGGAQAAVAEAFFDNLDVGAAGE